MKHFYSLKNVDLPDILGYLNDFAKNKNGKIIHWQIVPINLEGGFFPISASYACIIEFETAETNKQDE